MKRQRNEEAEEGEEKGLSREVGESEKLRSNADFVVYIYGIRYMSQSFECRKALGNDYGSNC